MYVATSKYKTLYISCKYMQLDGSTYEGLLVEYQVIKDIFSRICMDKNYS